MTSLNTAIFGVLCVELTSLLIMIAPMPSFIRGAVIRWISTSNMLASLQRPVMYLAIVVVAMWLATVHDIIKYAEEYQNVKASANTELANKLQVEVMLFRSQRNFYLSGSCVLLLLVIYRIYAQLKELNRLEATGSALKKQADGAMAAYKALQADKDAAVEELKALKKAGKGEAKGGEAKGAAAADIDADEELTRLREQNRKLAEQRTAAEKTAEALKRQSEGAGKEYERLLKENQSLENRLADFELVMGDAAKKSK